MKLGKAVAKVAKPVAEAADWMMGSNLQNCSGCSRRENKLDRWGDAAYDWIWQQPKIKITRAIHRHKNHSVRR